MLYNMAHTSRGPGIGLIQAKEQTICLPFSMFSENVLSKISQGHLGMNRLACTQSACSEVCPLSCTSNI